MLIDLIEMGLFIEKQIKVYYEDKEVGEYFADLVVDRCVIVELKTAEILCKEHELQLINYLKASEIEVGLLLNCGKKPEFKRKIFFQKRKILFHHNHQRHLRSIFDC